jgi:hypothetical protein
VSQGFFFSSNIIYQYQGPPVCLPLLYLLHTFTSTDIEREIDGLSAISTLLQASRAQEKKPRIANRATVHLLLHFVRNSSVSDVQRYKA